MMLGAIRILPNICRKRDSDDLHVPSTFLSRYRQAWTLGQQHNMRDIRVLPRSPWLLNGSPSIASGRDSGTWYVHWSNQKTPTPRGICWHHPASRHIAARQTSRLMGSLWKSGADEDETTTAAVSRPTLPDRAHSPGGSDLGAAFWGSVAFKTWQINNAAANWRCSVQNTLRAINPAEASSTNWVDLGRIAEDHQLTAGLSFSHPPVASF